MKERLQTTDVKTTEHTGRLVCIFINGKEYEISGPWQWDLFSDAVFCSDVFFSPSETIEGTLAIIHPDDKAYLLERLEDVEETKISFLQFRLITSYGEIKTITGKELLAVEVPSCFNKEVENLEYITEEKDGTKKDCDLILQKKASGIAEKLLNVGTWFYNLSTAAIYYSDEVYIIYGLPPQGLNAHLNLLHPYIHADDHDIVLSHFTKAFNNQLPLHIDFRIKAANDREKMVRHTTHWEYIEDGSLILFGTIQDITEAKSVEYQLEKIQYDLAFRSRLLQMGEQSANTGYWYINLITRKIIYSENVFRLHGIKPNALPNNSNIFLNFVHPEDVEYVKKAHDKILLEHAPPDIEYRIIRSDGKLRHIRQKGKLVVYGGNELVMMVTVQDLTTEALLSKKVSDLKDQNSLQQALLHQAEDINGMSSWVWDLSNDKIAWSDNIYSLFGFNANVKDFNQKQLQRNIHPDDKKMFADELQLFLQVQKESAFSFRILRLGQELWLTAHFKKISISGKDYFIATLFDVTKEHQLLDQMKEQEQIADHVRKNIQDALVITDNNNNITLWNKRSEEIYGHKKMAVLQRNFFDVLPQLKEEKTLLLFKQVFNGQSVKQQSVKIDGIDGLFDVNMVPMYADNGSVKGILHILHDVKKEQLLRQRLTERLNFIESLVEASVDRIIVMDRHMNYLYCNQKAADFYNLTKDEIIGKNVLEIFPNSINDPSFEHFRKALKGETIHIPAIDGLGDNHQYQVFLIPIIDDKQNVTAVLWMHHDLGSEMILQRQLKKADEILNTIDIGFIELDTDVRYKYVNPTAEKFLQKQKEEILGKKLEDVFPEVVHTPGYGLLLKALKEGVGGEAEYYSVVIKKWVYMSATPMGDSVVLLFYSRQELKETEQKLIEEHRQLLAAQHIGKIGSFEWIAGQDTVKVSDELLHIFGLKLSSKSITLERIDKMIHPDDLEDIRALRNQVMQQAGFYKSTFRIILKDGAVRHVNQIFESTATEGSPVNRIHGTLQDITERVEREQSLNTLNKQLDERNQELVKKNEELESFAFVASHDMKEPLRKIHTFSDWINKNEEPNLTAAGKTYLNRLQTSVKRMQLLIDDILDLSRLRTVEEELEEVELSKILVEIIEEWKPVIAEKKAMININVLPKIKAHPSQLYYLFNNLISNALKFTTIDVVPLISITGSLENKKSNAEPGTIENDWVKISISDNGIGFDEIHARKIFQIFQRLRSEQQFSGTGIGLTICKKVMENHNGFIEAFSKPGEGSVFNCYFPA